MSAVNSLSEGDVRRAQALAWVVLLAALAVFAIIAVGVPWLGVEYLRTATVAETASVEPKSGSVAIESVPGVPVLLQGNGPQEVAEGTTISTDAASKAFVRFPDGSTLSLEPDTRVTLRRLRRPRFRYGRVPRQIELVGAAQAGTTARLLAGSAWGDLRYDIVTPVGQVHLAPETHARLDLSDAKLTVVTADGQTEVTDGNRTIRLQADQRAVVQPDAGPVGPLPAVENALVNADFREASSTAGGGVAGWTFDRSPPRSGDTADRGQSEARTLPGGGGITFVRRNSGGSSADMLYQQPLHDLDVTADSFIGVSGTLRVLNQSLAGGGTARTEFPVILNLIFVTQTGEDYRWRVGFYAVPAAPGDPTANDLARYDVKVPPGQWYKFDSGNLLDPANPFGFGQRDLPRPVRLRRFEIVASGHDYESQVDSVGVWVK
jgi:hypothetical protein